MESFGKYQVIELVGEGGFGKVWKGYDPGLKRYVAIKTVSLTAPQAKERFMREAEIAANLHHPAIVTIHDFGEQDGVPYLVQEFLSGEDLALKIARRDAGDLRRRAGWLLQVAEGLHYAHQFGVIHRDIKPSNVRVLADGAVRIMDFGIAKLIDSEQKLTGTSLSVGTSGYVSPEALEGRSIDHRADIFSLGVMAYELITYVRPFDGPSVQSTLYRILTDEPEPIASLAPDCPPALSAIVERCLRKQRDDRYPDLAVVAAELRVAFDPGAAPAVAVDADDADVTRLSPTPTAPRSGHRTAPLPATAPSQRARDTVPATGPQTSAKAHGTGFQMLGLAAVAIALVAALVWAGAAVVSNLGGRQAAGGSGGPVVSTADSAADSLRLAGTDPLSGSALSFPAVDSPATGNTGRGGDPVTGSGTRSGDPAGGGTTRGGTGGTGSAGDTGQRADPRPPPASDTTRAGGEPRGGQEIVAERVLVLIRGVRSDAVGTAETIVLNELMARGRPIVDPGAIDQLRADASSMRALAAGASPAAGVGREYGAGMVVVAELTTDAIQAVGGFITGTAVLNARFYDTVSGRLVLSEKYEIGSGNTPGRAAATESAAITQAAESVARQLARAILRRPAGG